MSSTPQRPLEPAQRTKEDRLRMPGMIPQEIAIFNAWWQAHWQEYTDAQFNVRVGIGQDPGPAVPDEQRRNSILNTQHRIDAVLLQGNLPTIAEVKYRATHVVLGQLLAYRELYMRDNPASPVPALLLLCFQMEPDAEYVLRKFDIRVVLVDADLSAVKIVKP